MGEFDKDIGDVYTEGTIKKTVLAKETIDLGNIQRTIYTIKIEVEDGNSWYALREEDMPVQNTDMVTIRERWVDITAESLSDIGTRYINLVTSLRNN